MPPRNLHARREANAGECDDRLIDGAGEELPGRRILDGTDLEIAYNLAGDDLVIRVNKGGAQVFRVVFEDAKKQVRSGSCSTSPVRARILSSRSAQPERRSPVRGIASGRSPVR